NPLYSCFTPDEIEAIVIEAHSYGLKVAAHCQGGPSTQLFARAGLDSLEHGVWVDDADMVVMAENGTCFVPTLHAWLSQDPEQAPPPLRKAILAAGHAVARAKRAGVTVCAGSDSGHGKLAKELAYLVQWGLTETEAIRGATGLAACLCGIEDSVGTLAPGKHADLIAVEGNPLDDIKSVGRVDWVMKGGAVVHARPELLAAVSTLG
nr:amidohydrolase family protein [Dehalococcoidales bacterium]